MVGERQCLHALQQGHGVRPVVLAGERISGRARPLPAEGLDHLVAIAVGYRELDHGRGTTVNGHGILQFHGELIHDRTGREGGAGGRIALRQGTYGDQHGRANAHHEGRCDQGTHDQFDQCECRLPVCAGETVWSGSPPAAARVDTVGRDDHRWGHWTFASPVRPSKTTVLCSDPH